MHYSFKQARDHLRGELFGRQTVEETAEFIDALTAEGRRASTGHFLVWVRNSRPIFKVDGLAASFRQLAGSDVKIALLADSDEVRASQQYVAVLAAQHGAAVRAFRDETQALRWLAGQSQE